MSPLFVAGDRVVVTAGLSKDLCGEVVARWHDFAPGIPSFKVRFKGLLHCRVIRADFLAKHVEVAS